MPGVSPAFEYPALLSAALTGEPMFSKIEIEV
jgi:hypothetical protein